MLIRLYDRRHGHDPGARPPLRGVLLRARRHRGSCCAFPGKALRPRRPRFSLVKATLLVQIVISGLSCK